MGRAVFLGLCDRPYQTHYQKCVDVARRRHRLRQPHYQKCVEALLIVARHRLFDTLGKSAIADFTQLVAKVYICKATYC